MPSKRRSRLSKRRDPYGSDSSDSDYEPWQQETKARRKVRKTQTHSPARRRKAPSLVTPEQIIANAAAAKQLSIENDLEHHHRQRQDEHSGSDSPMRASTLSAPAPIAVAVASDSKASVKTELSPPAAQVQTEHRRETHVKTEAPRGAFVPTLARKDSDELAGVDLQSSDEEDVRDDDRVLEATADAGDDDDDVPMPAVFQCGACRSIVGDTYALVGSRKTSLMLSLSAVTNITMTAALQTARSGVHAGSSYYKLLCRECRAVLGRQYVATPSALDELRGLFCFRTPAIASYQLGVAQLQHRVAASDRAGDESDDDDSSSSSSSEVQVDRVGSL